MSDCFMIVDRMESVTGMTVLGTDTVNLAVSTVSARGTNSIEFDKVDGAAGTVFAGASKTIDLVNLNEHWFLPHAIIRWHVYVSDTAQSGVAYSFVRLGTDASNYAEWRFADSSIVAGRFTLCSAKLGNCYVTGTGCDFTNIDHLEFGVAFDAESDALADIKMDYIYLDYTDAGVTIA